MTLPDLRWRTGIPQTLWSSSLRLSVRYSRLGRLPQSQIESPLYLDKFIKQKAVSPQGYPYTFWVLLACYRCIKKASGSRKASLSIPDVIPASEAHRDRQSQLFDGQKTLTCPLVAPST